MRYSSIPLAYPNHREWDMHDSSITLAYPNHRE